jgi:hypothetical protein
MRQLLVTVTLALAVAFAALAQNPPAPDLSGTWVFNPAKSKLAKSMNIESETAVIISSRSTVKFHFTTNGKTTTRTYSVDGNEHFQSDMVSSPNHFRTYYTTKWEGAALVTHLRVRMETADTPMVGSTEGDRVTERWSLSPDRHVLIQTYTGNGVIPDELLVFDKQ